MDRAYRFLIFFAPLSPIYFLCYNICMTDMNILKGLVHTIIPEIVEIRHQLHQIPEIAFKEYKTSAKIREILEPLGMEFLPSIFETDVTAVLDSGKPGKTILLRSDIDALPIEEACSVLYRSLHPGFAHSCGHDGHMAILLGTAMVLSKMKEQINGKVRFLFQPGEESLAGAKSMVEAGYLQKEPVPDVAYALHGWPGTEHGCIECCPGPIMASTDDFMITLTGAGGHGAMPEKAVDLLAAAAGFILAMKEAVSWISAPYDPAVVSVCSVEGKGTFNVFADRIILKGTSRYLKDSTGNKIKKTMVELLDKYILPSGGKYEIVSPLPDYVSVNNDPELYSRAAEIAEKYLGREKWNGNGICSMCGDDFGFISRKIPSLYFRLGAGTEHASLHNPAYDFEDDTIENGILMMCGLVLG